MYLTLSNLIADKFIMTVREFDMPQQLRLGDTHIWKKKKNKRVDQTTKQHTASYGIRTVQRRMDRRTKRGAQSRSMRLKMINTRGVFDGASGAAAAVLFVGALTPSGHK